MDKATLQVLPRFHPIPAIWVYTTDARFNAGRPAGYPSFLSGQQQAQIERVRQARLLFGGQHRKYYLDEQRTGFDFPETRTGTRTGRLYLTVNYLKLISLVGSDLLFGQEPILRVAEKIQQGKLHDLAQRTFLHARFYTAAVKASAESVSFLEVCRHQGQVYVHRIPADEIFPLGELMPDGQFAQYVRFRLKQIGSSQQPTTLLLETHYLAGSITRVLWQLDENGQRQSPKLAIEQWSKFDGSPLLAESEPTGIDRNTITWLPNELDEDQPVSDYDSLLDLQDVINSKRTQMARIHAQYSDPVLAAPETSADDQGNARGDYKVYFFKSKDEIPGYVIADMQSEKALADYESSVLDLVITAESSPDLLGIKKGAAPDAAAKLKLAATKALGKAQRHAVLWKPLLMRVIEVAQDLENATPGNRYDRMPVSIELRDGLPIDELDQANTISILRAAGAMSTERAVGIQLGGDEDAAAEELARIKEENDAKAAAATPSVFFGGNGAGGEPGEAGAGSQISENAGSDQGSDQGKDQGKDQGVAA